MGPSWPTKTYQPVAEASGLFAFRLLRRQFSSPTPLLVKNFRLPLDELAAGLEHLGVVTSGFESKPSMRLCRGGV